MIDIEYLWVVILFFSTVSFFLMLLIVLIKSVKKNRYTHKVEILSSIEKNLNSYLISISENEGLRKQSVTRYQLNRIDKTLEGTYDKYLLISHLMQLKRNLSGEFDEALFDFYIKMGLPAISVKKLKRPNWMLQVAGLQELSEFQFQGSTRIVQRFLNASNRYTRQEAQIATIKSGVTNPKVYLKKEKDLTDWQKLRIHLIFKQKRMVKNLRYRDWMTHQAVEVKIFAIQLSILLNHIEMIGNVRKLMRVDDPKLKIATINAIAAYGNEQDISFLMKQLFSEDRKLVEASLKALGKVGEEEQCTNILRLIAKRHPSLLLLAIKCIHEITGDAESFFNKNPSLKSPKLNAMIDHVKEPLNQ